MVELLFLVLILGFFGYVGSLAAKPNEASLPQDPNGGPVPQGGLLMGASDLDYEDGDIWGESSDWDSSWDNSSDYEPYVPEDFAELSFMEMNGYD
jgi:hypothetical protein